MKWEELGFKISKYWKTHGRLINDEKVTEEAFKMGWNEEIELGKKCWIEVPPEEQWAVGNGAIVATCVNYY